jgi:hypothetical protein
VAYTACESSVFHCDGYESDCLLDVLPRILNESDRSFRGVYCHYHRGDAVWNVGQFLLDCMTQIPMFCTILCGFYTSPQFQHYYSIDVVQAAVIFLKRLLLPREQQSQIWTPLLRTVGTITCLLVRPVCTSYDGDRWVWCHGGIIISRWKPNIAEGRLLQCHFVHLECHLMLSKIEPGSPRSEDSVWPWNSSYCLHIVSQLVIVTKNR